MKKRRANGIIALCLLAVIAIIAVTWIIAPIIIYGWLGLMAVGMVYGGYMARHHIKSEVRRVIGEWKLKQLKEESD